MRVLSYNIHKGIGGRDQRYRLQRTIDIIEAENPDFICLQEVDRCVRRSRFDDQPSLLAKHFHPAGSLYQMNVHLKTGGYGNLLLSRWPLVEKHRVSIRYKMRKPRGAQLVIADTPQGPLHLVQWHLGLAERERHWQVQHLMKHQLFRRSRHLPTLIIGDTNDWRNTLHTGAFADNGFHQITTPPSRFRSFPAYAPLGSLDKAFHCGSLTILSAHLVRGPLTREASDHLPLVVDFQLKEPGTM